MAEARLLAIGQVVSELQGDFPGVTVSKVRFLESQGLISPQRTGKGYRKFSESDVARLHWILACQRDSFMPLRVIKERLAAVDWRAELVEAPDVLPEVDVGEKVQRLTPSEPSSARGAGSESTEEVSLTLPELARASGLGLAQARELRRYGLIEPHPAAEIDFYDAHALEVAGIARQMFELGLEPRHLRVFKASVDREMDLSVPAVQQRLQQGGPDSQREARELVTTQAALAALLREALIRHAIQNLT